MQIEQKVKPVIWAKDEQGFIYRIAEGTGDNLLPGDVEDGYVDYIYYDYFKSLDDVYENEPYDGGMILLDKLYQDMTEEEIIRRVAEFENTELTEIK